jgi:hypothetical protein
VLAALPEKSRRPAVVYTVDISADGRRYLWSEGSLRDNVALLVADTATETIVLRGEHA